jgi:hypothetical protein
MKVKEQIADEIYNYLKNNYNSYEDKRIRDKQDSYISYNVFGVNASISYIFRSNSLYKIELLVNNENICEYENLILYNKKFKFYKKIYNYFLKQKNEEKYNNIINIINKNKPTTVKRTEKIKNILN